MEQSIGKQIAAYRKKLGMTQEQLAKHMDVTNQAVSKWETDQSCPDIQLLPRLAEGCTASMAGSFATASTPM